MNEYKVILNLTSLATGGAGQYTLDFHKSLLDKGYRSYVAVRGTSCIYPDGTKHEIALHHKCLWNKFRRYCYRQLLKFTHFDPKWYSFYNPCERFTCYDARDIVEVLPEKPDVVFVHWVSDFANAKFVRDLERLTGAKVVFILVDHALYSGGCHYQMDCVGYKNGCYHCPATKSKLVQWGIAKNYAFKKRFLPEDIVIIAGDVDREKLSTSMIYKDCRFELVTTPMDSVKYCPVKDKIALRQRWNVPTDKKIVFFGATSLNEPRKGIQILLDAIPQMQNKDVVYMAAGNAKGLKLPQNTIYLGYLNEEQLIQAYQMADVFVCPTLADAGPMMVRQSLMCGTPVVAFPVGISQVLVKSGETGYLAEYGRVDDLAQGIDTIVNLSYEEYANMAQTCRRIAIEKCTGKGKQTSIETLIENL